MKHPSQPTHSARCLIAADIDKTILAQNKDEQVRFMQNVSPCLFEAAVAYYRKIKKGPKSLLANYDLSKISDTGTLVRPAVELRPVRYGAGPGQQEAHVQLTLKLILSFRHAKTKTLEKKLFEKDLRTWVMGEIQQRLDNMGLGHYVARAGGRSSVDVTLEKEDKAYAMRFLIERLNLQGHERLGEKFGTNAVYFGDEVIVGGGNDYPVTKIPGLLVFAVNNDRDLVPFHSRILVPSTADHGPDATARILRAFNAMAIPWLSDSPQKNKGDRGCRAPTVLEAFKREMFAGRVMAKINDIVRDYHATGYDWQALNAIVTLMHRQDRDSSRWMDILINELDDIMEQIASHPNGHKQAAIGASHPDR